MSLYLISRPTTDHVLTGGPRYPLAWIPNQVDFKLSVRDHSGIEHAAVVRRGDNGTHWLEIPSGARMAELKDWRPASDAAGAVRAA